LDWGRAKANGSDDNKALIAFAVGRAPYGCAPERLPSRLRIVPPSTQRRLKDEATSPRPSAKAHRTRLSGRVARFWSSVAPNHVDGRDNPRITSGDGHDAFSCRGRSFPALRVLVMPDLQSAFMKLGPTKGGDRRWPGRGSGLGACLSELVELRGPVAALAGFC
jgi:hypothetical protein